MKKILIALILLSQFVLGQTRTITTNTVVTSGTYSRYSGVSTVVNALLKDSAGIITAGSARLFARNLWSITGNAAMIDGTNFIGTTDLKPFNIRVNNTPAGRIDLIDNVYFGLHAGYASTLGGTYTGDKNSFFGAGCGYSDTSGYFNTAVGYYALFTNITTHDNTALGFWALRDHNVANGCTAVGSQAGLNSIDGSGCTFLGYAADVSGSIDNAMALGYGATVNASNKIQLGNASVTKFAIGTGSLETTASAGNLYYDNASGSIKLSTATPASGSVTSIATGNGITGGTITTTGTLGLSGATGDLGSFSGTNTYSAIAGVSAGSYLRSGGVFTLPVWSTTKLLNSGTANYIPYWGSTNTQAENINFQYSTSSGLSVGGAPGQVIPGGDPAAQNEFISNGGGAKFFMNFIVPGSEYANWHSYKFNGTIASPSATLLNDYILSWGFRGWATGGFTQSSAAWQVQATQNWTASAQGSKHIWGVTPNGSIARNSAMTLDQDSYLKLTTGAIIGATSLIGTELLSVQGNTNGGFIGGYIKNASTGSSAYTQFGLLNSSTNFSILHLGTTWVTSAQHFQDGTTLQTSGTGGLSIAAINAAGAIRFYPGGTTERMRIETTGNVGIGTTTTSGAFLNTGAGTTSLASINLKSGTVKTTPASGDIEYDGTSLFFTNSGAQRQELPQIQQSRVNAQIDVSASTTFANITGLTSTLVTGKYYRVEIFVMINTDAVGGAKMRLSGGSATMTDITLENNVIANDLTAFSHTEIIGALTTSISDIGNSEIVYSYKGIIKVNTGGTFIPQFAQQAASGTSSVLKGSYMALTQIN